MSTALHLHMELVEEHTSSQSGYGHSWFCNRQYWAMQAAANAMVGVIKVSAILAAVIQQ